MQSLSDQPGRHVVIDRRPGQYLCFPDVCLAGDGSLVCAYNEFDRHVGSRRRLLVKRSVDGGRTWEPPQLVCVTDSHCPRLSRLSDDTLLLIDDVGPILYFSLDHGRTWAAQPGSGLGHGLQDRVLELDFDTLVTAGHQHRGSQIQPKIRQAPTEQMCYRSINRGRTWEAASVIAAERALVLCEASLIRLPNDPTGQDLIALMRENSFVGEPMYWSGSNDGGRSWSLPKPTPIVGHRPTMGLTSGGRLLVTYRDVGPDPGTKAWLGTFSELFSDFQVHGLHPAPDNPTLAPEGLLIKNGSGPLTATSGPVRYGLRPMTDPEFARAEFFCDVRVDQADESGCGIRLGHWWKLFPNRLQPDIKGAPSTKLRRGEWNQIRLVYEPGLCHLFVNGRLRGKYPVDPMLGESRPILVGAVARREANGCEVLWRRMALAIEEPRLGRSYRWAWDHTMGLPDAPLSRHVLELKNDRMASLADFGYSGWAELPQAQGGGFFCVYHHGGGDEPDYREGYSAHILGTRFDAGDFGG